MLGCARLAMTLAQIGRQMYALYGLTEEEINAVKRRS